MHRSKWMYAYFHLPKVTRRTQMRRGTSGRTMTWHSTTGACGTPRTMDGEYSKFDGIEVFPFDQAAQYEDGWAGEGVEGQGVDAFLNF